MDLRSQQIKDTYANLTTIGTVAGSPTTGTLQNGAGSNVTALTIAGDLTATNVTGTLQTAAQTNITSVGTLTGLSVSGTTGLDGAVTINNSKANVDFRVAGDNETNLLFVDASADRVGIGTSSPTRLLTLASSDARIIRLQHSSTPKIEFIDTGTGTNGAYIGATANSLVFETFGQTERMRIDASGNFIFNENGNDSDFRVEGDTDTHLIFADAGNDRVGIGTSSPAQKLSVNGNIVGATIFGSVSQIINTSAVAMQIFSGNANAQGTARKYTIVRQYPVVSLGTKLIIPFISQVLLNGATLCKVYGMSARYNNNIPDAFEINFAVNSLNSLSSLTSWGGAGNYSSIAINGMNIEITFTNAYTSGTANGIFVTIEYMPFDVGKSIDVANIAMN